MLNKPEDKFIHILNERYCRLYELVNYNGKIVELDLGCGKGSFTTRLGERFPERTIFAADVMIGRLRKLQKRNMRQDINNIIPLRVEARHLVSCLIPDKTINRLHLLCPDPWPKDRHRSNRLLCSNFLIQIHRILKDDGCFHFSTDDIYYFKAAKKIFEKSGLFTEDNSRLDDIKDIKSDFEIRWNDMDKKVNHICWIKNAQINQKKEI